VELRLLVGDSVVVRTGDILQELLGELVVQVVALVDIMTMLVHFQVEQELLVREIEEEIVQPHIILVVAVEQAVQAQIQLINQMGALE
jgi:hypothetical protein